jgi:orotidine-5'-phosphate decarboxylase
MHIFPKPIICALDTTDLSRAKHLASILRPYIGAVKIGLECFTAHGHEAVRAMTEMDIPVFLDLKFHDIPNTVAGAIRAACMLDVQMITIHASGGSAMMKEAVHTIEEISWTLGKQKPHIIAVTMLTSMSQYDLQEIGIDLPIGDHVLRLAELARKSGMDGIVCSPHEIDTLRTHIDQDLTLVVPGIRPEGSAQSDQKRTMTPREALSKGADYLVIGRPITKSKNPVHTIQAITESMISHTS